MKKRTGKSLRMAFICVIWLIIWQAASMSIQNDIIFVGPIQVLEALMEAVLQEDFWITVLSSFGKISLGFLSAFLSAVLVGGAASRFSFLREFLSPFMALLKSVPVASFVILALIWMGSERLSIFIAFMVVFPMIYESTLTGVEQTDPALLEMARVFKVPAWKKILYIYRPGVKPYLIGSCRTALAMSWKSGVAAEVIGIPDASIGEKLYMAKIYLNTAELFAWTLVIILVSAVFERLFLWLLRRL